MRNVLRSVSLGANYNWGEVQRRRLAEGGDRPVRHYWDHVQWVFGKDSVRNSWNSRPG